jgi:hypothetical protein
MRIRRGLATLALLPAVAGPPAHAGPPWPVLTMLVVVPHAATATFSDGATAQGLTCGLVAVEPNPSTEEYHAVLTAVPVVVTPAGTDYVWCEVQVNENFATDNDFGRVKVEADFVAAPADVVSVCTTWIHDGEPRNLGCYAA